MKPALPTLFCAALTLAVFAGCDEHKPQAKKAADAIKEAGSKTGEALKEAGAKTGDALKEAGAKTGEALKESADKVRASIHEATKPAEPQPSTPVPATTLSPLDRTVTDIDGKEANLADYKGKVVLIVNVASKCGYTGQYAGLESLYASRKDNGFTLLGFPSNDFGQQEPGTEAQIKTFCTDTYHVTFPMFAKVAVKGDQASDLYKALAAATPNAALPPLGEPKWNFTKYLLNRKGQVVAKFDSAVAPDDARLTAAIDAALAEK